MTSHNENSMCKCYICHLSLINPISNYTSSVGINVFNDLKNNFICIVIFERIFILSIYRAWLVKFLPPYSGDGVMHYG